MVSGVGHAMVRAHTQEVIHRDLKPDNVFLVDDAGRFFVKVLDLGSPRLYAATAPWLPRSSRTAGPCLELRTI